MERMFYNAESFNGDLSLWDVTTMNAMIFGASSFNCDLSSWDFKNRRFKGFLNSERALGFSGTEEGNDRLLSFCKPFFSGNLVSWAAWMYLHYLRYLRDLCGAL